MFSPLCGNITSRNLFAIVQRILLQVATRATRAFSVFIWFICEHAVKLVRRVTGGAAHNGYYYNGLHGYNYLFVRRM